MQNFILSIKKHLKSINWIKFSIFCAIIIVLFVIDLISKQYVYSKYIDLYNKDPYFKVHAVPYLFDVTLAFNKGAAWSVGFGMVGLFSMISLIAGIILICCFIYYFSTVPTFVNVCLALAIAGDFGNFVDRFGCWIQKGIYKDGVVDFITFAFWDNFPTFNIADSYLVIAIFIAIIGLIYTLIKTSLVSKKVIEETETKENQDDFKNKLSMKQKEDESNKN